VYHLINIGALITCYCNETPEVPPRHGLCSAQPGTWKQNLTEVRAPPQTLPVSRCQFRFWKLGHFPMPRARRDTKPRWYSPARGFDHRSVPSSSQPLRSACSARLRSIPRLQWRAADCGSRRRCRWPVCVKRDQPAGHRRGTPWVLVTSRRVMAAMSRLIPARTDCCQSVVYDQSAPPAVNRTIPPTDVGPVRQETRTRPDNVFKCLQCRTNRVDTKQCSRRARRN
jgi:hypothetical protein